MLAGFPVVDVEATTFDGGWHETDSSPVAFETAALTAFRYAQQKVGVGAFSHFKPVPAPGLPDFQGAIAMRA